MTLATAELEPPSSSVKPAERRAHGKRLRDTASRDAHAAWRAHSERADPIGILRAAAPPIRSFSRHARESRTSLRARARPRRGCTVQHRFRRPPV